MTACLRDEKTFQRGEVEHLTNDCEVLRLGVTISPIDRTARAAVRSRARCDGAARNEGERRFVPDERFNRADRTAKTNSLEGNLAALGEMSAGIAHELKNALATISGYAQMIRSESAPGETRDSAERILDQTRALTHVVRNFCVSPNPWKSAMKR